MIERMLAAVTMKEFHCSSENCALAAGFTLGWLQRSSRFFLLAFFPVCWAMIDLLIGAIHYIFNQFIWGDAVFSCLLSKFVRESITIFLNQGSCWVLGCILLLLKRMSVRLRLWLCMVAFIPSHVYLLKGLFCEDNSEEIV